MTSAAAPAGAARAPPPLAGGGRAPSPARRAACAAAVAVAAFGVLGAIEGPRRAGRAAGAAAQALGPGAASGGVALLAGAFRPIAADFLWLRFLAHQEAREHQEMLAVAWAILALDPTFEKVWAETAWTVGVDLPAGFEDDPEATWMWRRQGLLILKDGARRNPRSSLLLLRQAQMVAWRVAPDPPLAARFRADRALNPEGLEAAEAARRFEERARALAPPAPR